MSVDGSDAVLLGVLAAAIFGIGFALVRARRARRGGRGRATAAAALDRHEFTRLVAQAFRQQGFQIVDAAASAEVDLVLRRDRETLLVLCKHWRSAKVGVDAMQHLHAAVAARGANGGIALTSGRFARAAVAYAGTSNIRLIEGQALQGLLDTARERTAA